METILFLIFLYLAYNSSFNSSFFVLINFLNSLSHCLLDFLIPDLIQGFTCILVPFLITLPMGDIGVNYFVSLSTEIIEVDYRISFINIFVQCPR